MATYSTDLTTLTTAEAGTWTELASPYNAGGTPAADGENYIQGTDCFSQSTGTKTGLVFSIVFDAGADQAASFATDDVVLIWSFYAVGVNLNTYANGGMRAVIAADLSNADAWAIGGSDYARNPYGGWINAAVDPTLTPDYTIGSGTAGVWRYFGTMPNTLNAISKGTPHAVDAIRYGRGLLSLTGSGGTFSEIASYNDYNAGSTPPGTSSTSVDSGRHRLGLFQDNGGTYLWKGLLSFGVTATSCTFTDSNETIIVDDAAKTYTAFNKIEVHNASSSVTWNNITFISLGTTSPGSFEMVDDATFSATGCSFNSMGTFIFDSNSTITDCVFNTCGQITSGAADMDGCSFNQGTAATAVLAATPAEAALITNCTFISDGTGNGLEITGTAADFTLTGVDFSGYSTTVDANKAIYVNIATGTVNITISGGSGVTAASHVRTAGATINVIVGAVTVKVTATTETGGAIQSAYVHLRASNATGPFPYQEAVTIARSGTTATVTHTGHGMASNDKILLRGISDKTEDNTVHQITVTGTNTYTYTTTDSGSTSYTGSNYVVDGQDETAYDNTPTTEGTFTGGTGYAVSDEITLTGGTVVTVDAVSTGVVTQFTVNSGRDGGGRTTSEVLSQIWTTGSGTGFSLTLDTDNLTGSIIKSTFVALNGTTDVNGEISATRVYSTDQPVVGWARKSTSSPYFKQGGVTDTIDNLVGLDYTAVLVSDE